MNKALQFASQPVEKRGLAPRSTTKSDKSTMVRGACPRFSTGCLAALLGLCFASASRAADLEKPAPTAPQKALPVPGETFLVKGLPAFVMLPVESERRKPQPWIWYAPTLPGYPDQHEKWMREHFVAADIAVAGVDVGESYGSPAGQEGFTAFYKEMTERRGFAPRPCLLGRSRGGLMVASWAVEHPESVAGIAGIYPVFDFRTYPGLDKAAAAYGVTPKELGERIAEHNPIAKVASLAKARVPAFFIHGDVDTVVPLKENSAEFQRRYEAQGAAAAVNLLVIKDQGHNFWEGFFKCQELVDFAIARARDGAKPSPPPVPVDLGQVTEKHVLIPMRDGVNLSAYLYFPPGEGPWPVIFEQRYADLRAPATRQSFARLAAGGYVFAAVNFRGTHLSEGTWVGYRDLGWGEKQDGYDTCEWLAKQPWTTGKIGTFGSSQAGFAQNFLAVAQPPHLACQYMIDTGLSLFHEGYRIGGTTRPERFVQMGGVCRDPSDNRKLLDAWFAHPTYDDYWAQEDCTRFIDKMNVPCFTVGSWYDFMCVGSVDSYIGRKHQGGGPARAANSNFCSAPGYTAATKKRTRPAN